MSGDSDAIPVVRLSGELEITRAPELRRELMDAVGNRDAGLVIDLTEASYLDSAGVNVLFEVAEALRGRQVAVALVVPEGGLVDRVVQLVDLDSIARLHRSVDAAVVDIGGG